MIMRGNQRQQNLLPVSWTCKELIISYTSDYPKQNDQIEWNSVSIPRSERARKKEMMEPKMSLNMDFNCSGMYSDNRDGRS